MEIRESEKRRARNLIWNAAGEYGYEPDFKAYDAAGQADLVSMVHDLSDGRDHCGGPAEAGLCKFLHFLKGNFSFLCL